VSENEMGRGDDMQKTVRKWVESKRLPVRL
jgi:hypothetical protein